MNCPVCNSTNSVQNKPCLNCGFDFKKIKWVTIVKVYPPQDIIIVSLLESSNIPVKVIKREVYGFPVAIGPLAEVKILVPDNLLEEAKCIINEID